MPQVTPDQCELFYPFVIGVNNDGQIVYLSKPLSGKLGSDHVGKSFHDVFQLSRPRVDIVDEQFSLLDYRSHLLLFSDITGKLGLRGQVVPGYYDDQSIALIAASPWLTWLNEHVENYQPEMSDFSIQDAQLDLNLHLHTQSIMLSDLQRLAEQLTKARDEAQHASTAKSTFVSHVTHELRTPLTGITGLIDLMEDLPLCDEASELLGDLKASSHHLMHVVNQVLDFSRLKESTDHQFICTFEPCKLVSETVALLEPLAKAKNLSVGVNLDSRLQKLLEGDVLKIQKSLINLLSNAIKYSDSGHIRVVVLVQQETEEKVVVSFQVEDEGPGVAEADRPHLFEEFWTKDAPGMSKVTSTGLGLCITKEMIESMGGSLGMRPKSSGTGSEFWFELELARATVREVVQAKPSSGSSGAYCGKLLVVDDNRVNRTVAALMLRKLGMEVDQVAGGMEAIEAANDNRYDLILMDVQMPDIDGLEAAQRIRQAAGSSCPPIVAWSANCTEQDITDYKAVGMDGALTKPVIRSDLADMLSQHLRPTSTT